MINAVRNLQVVAQNNGEPKDATQDAQMKEATNDAPVGDAPVTPADSAALSSANLSTDENINTSVTPQVDEPQSIAPKRESDTGEDK
jgi:hypothetical protein